MKPKNHFISISCDFFFRTNPLRILHDKVCVLCEELFHQNSTQRTQNEKYAKIAKCEFKSHFVKFSIILLLLSLSLNSTAQKRAYNWVFGNNAGLDFNYDPPRALSQIQLNTLEGCASISNREGELLFYTDGLSIWDGQGTLVIDQGLQGHGSATQSGVIMSFVNDDSKFYVFTVDACFHDLSNGLNYSVVQVDENKTVTLTGEGGKLHDRVAEKIGIIQANDEGFWLLSHAYGNNSFYANWVNESGIQPTVVSSVGAAHSFSNDPSDDCGTYGGARGYMRFSPNGKKVAVAVAKQDLIEIFDFDPSTGKLTNPVSLSFINEPYGLDFSPNGEFLYVSSVTQGLYQLDVRTVEADYLEENAVLLIRAEDLYMGAVQKAPDRKIYVTSPLNDKLHVIKNPNKKFPACMFQSNALDISPGVGAYGLPTFSEDFLQPKLEIWNFCLGEETKFQVNDFAEIKSVTWDFGEGNPTTTSETEISHVYSRTGSFVVQLNVEYVSGKSETLNETITIYGLPTPNLTSDSPVCGGSATIRLENPDEAFRWSTGETTETEIQVEESGIYSVEMWNLNGCKSSKQIEVKVNPVPEIISVKNNGPCFRDENIKLEIEAKGESQLWYSIDGGSTFSTNSLFSNLSEGEFTVVVKNEFACETSMSKVVVKPESYTEYAYHVDWSQNRCFGDENAIFFVREWSGVAPHTTTLWDEESQVVSDFSKLGGGNYTLEIVDANQCVFSRSVYVYCPPLLENANQVSHVTCNGGNNGSFEFVTTGGTPPYTYWFGDDISTEAQFLNLKAGTYEAKVVDGLSCEVPFSVEIQEPSAFEVSLSGTDVLCAGQATGVIEVSPSFSDAEYEYIWEKDSETSDVDMNAVAAGWYKLKVTDYSSFVCAVDSVFIDEPELFTLDYSKEEITCPKPYGSIDFSMTGGVEPYNFVLTDQENNLISELSNLTASTYSLRVNDANGCVLEEQINLPEPDCTSVLEMPNVFSPNADGSNDVFTPKTKTNIKVFRMKIFSRWGRKIFEAKTIDEVWDGKIGNAHASEGTYFYAITAEGYDGQHFQQNGSFYLMP